MNGDGFDDLIIGADDADPNGSNSGESYVVFGFSTNTAPSVNDTSFSINEDAVNNDSVGTVTGTDVDGDSLTYSICAGNDDGIFAINSSTGEITIANNTNLDYETTTSYNLTVEASDGSLSDTATVTVNVGDINETPSISDTSFNINEDAANNDITKMLVQPAISLLVLQTELKLLNLMLLT